MLEVLATVANVREVSDKFGNREAEAAKKRERESEKTCSSVSLVSPPIHIFIH